jgi:hypothetical protein
VVRRGFIFTVRTAAAAAAGAREFQERLQLNLRSADEQHLINQA